MRDIKKEMRQKKSRSSVAIMSAASSDRRGFKSHRREIMLHELTRVTHSECTSLQIGRTVKSFENGTTGLAAFQKEHTRIVHNRATTFSFILLPSQQLKDKPSQKRTERYSVVLFCSV